MENSTISNRASVTDYSFVGKVFLYMFIALLVTAGVSVGLGYLFSTVFNVKTDPSAANVYYGLMIASSILLLVVSIWFSVAASKGKTKNIIVPFAFMTIIMGFFLSSFVMYLPFWMLALAFGITAAIFGLLALATLVFKANFGFLPIIMTGLLGGIGILCLVNIPLAFFAPAAFSWIYVIIEGALLVYMIIVTTYELYAIRKVADAGGADTPTALMFAYSLYLNFIYILIRILRWLAIAFARSR